MQLLTNPHESDPAFQTPLLSMSGTPLYGLNASGRATATPLRLFGGGMAAGATNAIRYDYGQINVASVSAGYHNLRVDIDYDTGVEEVVVDERSDSDQISDYSNFYGSDHIRRTSESACLSAQKTMLQDLYEKTARGWLTPLDAFNGRLTLGGGPFDVYNGNDLVNARIFLAFYDIYSSGTSGFNSQYGYTRCFLRANNYLRPMVWAFPTCATGCALKLAVPLSLLLSSYVNTKSGRHYPTFGSFDVTLSIVPVEGTWNNTIPDKPTLDRYAQKQVVCRFENPPNKDDLAHDFKQTFEIILTVPPSRVVLVFADMLSTLDALCQMFREQQVNDFDSPSGYSSASCAHFWLACYPFDGRGTAVPVVPVT